MQSHRAIVPIVVGRSATVYGKAATLGGLAATVLIVAGRSATVGTVAEKYFLVILLPCMPLFLYL